MHAALTNQNRNDMKHTKEMSSEQCIVATRSTNHNMDRGMILWNHTDIQAHAIKISDTIGKVDMPGTIWQF